LRRESRAVSADTVAVVVGAGQYAGRTWSLWLATVAFLFAPFWFNPLAFEWQRVRQDYTLWIRWMTTTGGAATNSWDTW
jgi:callose synthase